MKRVQELVHFVIIAATLYTTASNLMGVVFSCAIIRLIKEDPYLNKKWDGGLADRHRHDCRSRHTDYRCGSFSVSGKGLAGFGNDTFPSDPISDSDGARVAKVRGTGPDWNLAYFSSRRSVIHPLDFHLDAKGNKTDGA